ncbi:hypothetical protein MINT15_28220 [Saccharomonospora viridis]|uniref:Uncharacterized protein n=1 Tax=Saccharomonospora viridis TaxID=1852 RepID=A0A837D4Q5_9PSEU|nr:hypothetical protein MINT15_28220 [Saccharomonospora viridis]
MASGSTELTAPPLPTATGVLAGDRAVAAAVDWVTVVRLAVTPTATRHARVRCRTEHVTRADISTSRWSK